MPVIIVTEATDSDGLASRLLRGNVNRTTREAAVRALREANPGVDIDRVKPGDVIVVPEVRGVRANIGDIVEPGLGAATERIHTRLDGLAAAIELGAAQRAAARDVAVAALRDPAVKRAVKGDESAAAVVASLKEALAGEEREETAQQELLADALTAWSEDLAQVSRMWSAEND